MTQLLRLLSIFLIAGLALTSRAQDRSPSHLVAALAPDTSLQYKIPAEITESEKIRLNVEGFSEYPGGGYTVYLGKMNSSDNRMLPIVIGRCEAMGISRQMAGREFHRPLTYKLFTNFIKQSKTRLLEISVIALKGGTFYARILFEKEGKQWEMDARPSDAINLALRMEAPIYTYQKVMDAAGQNVEMEGEEEEEEE